MIWSENEKKKKRKKTQKKKKVINFGFYLFYCSRKKVEFTVDLFGANGGGING
jgi:hypothetical protein